MEEVKELIPYYEETRLEQRLPILEEMIASGEDAEINEVRKELFDLRYKAAKGFMSAGMTDKLLGFWIVLEYLKNTNDSKGQIKSAQKRISKELKDSGFDVFMNKDELHREVFRAEVANMLELYTECCANDTRYGSTLFGLKKIDKEAVHKKFRDDIKKTGIKLPKLIGMEEELKIFMEESEKLLDKYYDQRKLR